MTKHTKLTMATAEQYARDYFHNLGESIIVTFTGLNPEHDAIDVIFRLHAEGLFLRMTVWIEEGQLRGEW